MCWMSNDFSVSCWFFRFIKLSYSTKFSYEFWSWFIEYFIAKSRWFYSFVRSLRYMRCWSCRFCDLIFLLFIWFLIIRCFRDRWFLSFDYWRRLYNDFLEHRSLLFFNILWYNILIINHLFFDHNFLTLLKIRLFVEYDISRYNNILSFFIPYFPLICLVILDQSTSSCIIFEFCIYILWYMDISYAFKDLEMR